MLSNRPAASTIHCLHTEQNQWRILSIGIIVVYKIMYNVCKMLQKKNFQWSHQP